MRYPFLILYSVLICTYTASAQRYEPFVVRADLSMPLRKGAGLGLEWRYGRTKAIALQASWEQHSKATENDLFNGDLVANFSELQSDTLSGLGYYSNHTTGTIFIGEGRPLPVLPEHIALSSLSLRLGHKFVFGKKGRKWNWSLQPSLSVIRHHYFEINQTYELLEEVTQRQIYGTYPYKWEVLKIYRVFHENQTMREYVKWISGLAYEIGLARKLNRKWSLEVRVSGLYNPNPAHKAPQTTPARVVQARAHLFVGYAIGRKR
jgi:hypothetical protein